MQFFKFATIGAIAALQTHSVLAAPYDLTLVPRQEVACDPISMYTVDWFLDNKILTGPIQSNCLFYTAWLSAIAQRFANSGGADLETIWDIWPCNLYNGNVTDVTNPLRCFFQEANDGDATNRTAYFRAMSEAMAVSCDIFATVMTNFTDNIPQDGIWGQTELPALMRTGNVGGQVDTVVAVNITGGDLRTIYERDGTAKRETGEIEVINGNIVPAYKRQDNADLDRCYSPDQLQEWFGAVPW